MPMKKFKWNISAEKLRVPLILALILIFALFLRVYWGLEPSIQNGYAVSGGSDSYYHEKIIGYILTHRHQLLEDPMLNYPIGAINPRPPLFHWAIVLMGYVFAPFIGEYNGAILSLILFPAIFSTLSIIVVYLLGKEAFNRKVGLIAALFIAIMPGDIMRGVVTQADWDAFDLFFILLIFYFFLMALKKVHYRNWVKDWFSKGEVKEGLGTFFRENKLSVVYAALSGMSLASLALAWKGFTYGLTILLMYLFIQVFINRFRNKSNLHIAVFTFLLMVIGFGLAFPWYYITHRIPVWFDVPFLLTLGVFLLAAFLEITGKYPWPLVFSATAAVIAGTGTVAALVFPKFLDWVLSGQGYFVKSKLYSTIAEAQPASLGYIAMSAGIAIFMLAFGGIFLMIYEMRKQNREYYIFFVIYSVIAIYMALSAARFIYNASPAFAIAGAIGLVWVLDALHFRETFEELRKYRGNFKKKVKVGLKFSQVSVALIIAFLLVVPTVWSAVDAGIPYTEKKKLDKEIYESLPSFMRPNSTAYNKSSPWYLGAFGYSLPKPDYPWERAWRWLSEQDNSTPPEYRPGFVSWWDYGFECIEKGKHPTVADNFQYGYQFAAQELMAQNESEAIALFIVRLMEGDYYHHNKNFSTGMMKILHEYFTDSEISKIELAFRDPAKLKDTVLNDPNYYGLYSSDILPNNVKYAYLKAMFAHHGQGFLINLYDSVRNYTHKDIRYFAVDYRLFPFNGRDTGIFYAPAKLGGRRIHQFGGTVIPYDFYDLKAVDQYGNEYELNKVPANAHIVNYKIIYKPMFYHSMLYRTFIGYYGKEVGLSDGIPGISSGMYNYNPMQAWNLTHFKLVYRTAFWNPYKDYQNHTNAWKPIPVELALKYKKEHKGTVELNPPAYRILPNDVVMIKFYEGAIIKGQVKLSTGQPLKHIRITLLDEYGIPHETVFTDSTGHYKLYAVAGNLTLVASTNGEMNKIEQVEQTHLYIGHVNVSEAQAERLVPNITIVRNIVVKPSNLDGMVFFDKNRDKKYDAGDVKINDGTIILENSTYGIKVEGKIVNGLYHLKDLAPHTYVVHLLLNGRYFSGFKNITLKVGQNLTKDIPLIPSFIKGNVTYSDGRPASFATVTLHGDYDNYVVHTNANGSFEAIVLPDNYTVVASNGTYASPKQTVIVNSWNFTTSVNITMRHAFSLDARAMYGGKLVSGVYFTITSDLRPYNTYILKTDGDGELHIKLPGGFYTVYSTTYVDNTRVVYVKFLNLNHNMSLTMNMVRAYRISGYVRPTTMMTPPSVSVYGSNFFYRGYANDSGYYEIYMPAGRYIVSAIGFDNNITPYFAREIVNLHTNLNVDLTLQKAYNVTGHVYYDANGNGRMDKNETIYNGLVYLYDSHGVYEIRNIPPDGTFTLPTTINYHVGAKIWGYGNAHVSGKNPNYTISVEPNTVLVQGNVYRDNMPNDLPVNITFVCRTHSFTVHSVTSKYSIRLIPGNYTIKMWGYERIYDVINNTLKVNTGFESQTHNIEMKAYAQITVVSQASTVTWYLNGKNYTMGKTVKLPVGDYTLYAYNVSKAAMRYVKVTHNETIEVPLETAYFVYPLMKNATISPRVSISAGDMEITINGGAVRLPEGTYVFRVRMVSQINGTYYVYTAYNKTTVSNTKVVNMWVVRKLLVTHVTGRLVAPITVSNTIVKFIEVGDTQRSIMVTTSSSGTFSAELVPGDYIVYTYFIGGSTMLANISYVSFSGNHGYLNITMQPAHMLSGSTYINNKKIATTVNIETQHGTLKVNSTGYYWVILPDGKYNLTAFSYRKEYGLDITYYFRGNVSVHSNVNFDLHLRRDTVHIVQLSLVGVDTIAVPNTTIGVTVAVKNSGNTPENVSLEGVGGWTVQNSKKIFLNPGDSKMVALRVHVPLTASYGNTSFQIRALFSGFEKTISVTTHVGARYFTNISKGTARWDNNSLVYSVTLTNGGNRWVNYTLTVLNRLDLENKGWNVRIYVNGHEQNWVNISKEDKANIKIVATATRPHPGVNEPILLSVSGGKVYIRKFTLFYPEMTSAVLYVEGGDIQNYTGNEVPQYLYWVWGVVGALGVAIVLAGRKRR